jgi:hypothetical protein
MTPQDASAAMSAAAAEARAVRLISMVYVFPITAILRWHTIQKRAGCHCERRACMKGLLHD